MGEPAQPTPVERRERVTLARKIVDAVREDNIAPSTIMIGRFAGAQHNARTMIICEAGPTAITAAQDIADQAREELDIMFFALSQEVEMLDIERRALEARVRSLEEALRCPK